MDVVGVGAEADEFWSTLWGCSGGGVGWGRCSRRCCTRVNCFSFVPSLLDGRGFGTVRIFRESTPGKVQVVGVEGGTLDMAVGLVRQVTLEEINT